MNIQLVRYSVAILWGIAGTFVFKTGISVFLSDFLPLQYNLTLLWVILLFFGSLFLFSWIIFPNVYTKNALNHNQKFNKYGKIYPCHIFSLSTWIIMTIMISGSAYLRIKGYLPNFFFAGFYTGLGLSMFWLSFRFILSEKHPINSKKK